MSEVQNAEAGNGKAKTEVVKVTMTDGREVEFAGKRLILKSAEIDGSVVQVRFDFRNGQTRSFIVPDSLLLPCAAHGASQKIGDAAAGEKDLDDAILAIEDTMGRLENGEWNIKREGGSGFSGTSVLLRAIAEFRNLPVETVKAFLADRSPAEKLALRASKELKPIIERLEAEKVSKTANVDTGALLGLLEAV